MAFFYKNTEKRMHGGKRVTQRVLIVGNKGFKSVSTLHKNKMRTVRKSLKRREICNIKKRKFIKGLFDDCRHEE
jgi:hypothetical protein